MTARIISEPLRRVEPVQRSLRAVDSDRANEGRSILAVDEAKTRRERNNIHERVVGATTATLRS